MNKIFLTGNLTRNPEMRATKDGIQVTSFTIAVNGRGPDGTRWFKINAWRKLSKISEQGQKRRRLLGVFKHLYRQ